MPSLSIPKFPPQEVILRQLTSDPLIGNDFDINVLSAVAEFFADQEMTAPARSLNKHDIVQMGVSSVLQAIPELDEVPFPTLNTISNKLFNAVMRVRAVETDLF